MTQVRAGVVFKGGDPHRVIDRHRGVCTMHHLVSADIRRVLGKGEEGRQLRLRTNMVSSEETLRLPLRLVNQPAIMPTTNGVPMNRLQP